AVVALVAEYEPVEVVVGLPRSLSGGEGPAATAVRAKAQTLADALAAATPRVAVRLVDERLTTVSAARQLRAGGMRARKQRGVIDAAAATAILQHALDAERSRDFVPGELVSPAGATPQAAPEGTDP
ncbi:MAG: Holliday junction resolvase RuvX, partial [Actinomycetes bacterium]